MGAAIEDIIKGEIFLPELCQYFMRNFNFMTLLCKTNRPPFIEVLQAKDQLPAVDLFIIV